MKETYELVTADDTRAFGRRLASTLRAGDLIILTGGLGAGKTTLTQGIGEGLNVRGPIASPTFVIARYHPPLGPGPGLVHVDAYRISSLDEIDALDLDAGMEDSVTVVEWGAGLVESLTADRLDIAVTRPRGLEPGAETRDLDLAARTITVTGHGERWAANPSRTHRVPELDRRLDTFAWMNRLNGAHRDSHVMRSREKPPP